MCIHDTSYTVNRPTCAVSSQAISRIRDHVHTARQFLSTKQQPSHNLRGCRAYCMCMLAVLAALQTEVAYKVAPKSNITPPGADLSVNRIIIENSNLPVGLDFSSSRSVKRNGVILSGWYKMFYERAALWRKLLRVREPRSCDVGIISVNDASAHSSFSSP